MFSSGGRVCRVLTAVAVCSVALAGSSRAAEPPVYAWVEAEETASINFEDFWTGMDRPHLLSGGKWLAAHFEEKDIPQKMPEGGFVLTYDVDAPEAGGYGAWARVGWDWSRAPFQWRIGRGKWRDGPADKITRNLMQLKDWNNVSWLDLGAVQLPKGRSTLTVRYRETSEVRKDMWLVLDCFAFVKGAWLPEGRLKPGETYDSELDRTAAGQVFQFPEAPGGVSRTEMKLNGPWQVARYDDMDMDVGAWEPVRELPEADVYPLRWMGVDVPHSLWGKDETIFAHRVVYRTRVNVPAGHAGRGFNLHFSGTNWIASVFINGALAGSHKGVWIPWDLDVRDFIKPGQVNEIAVAIKGPYYAIDVPNTLRYCKHGDLDRARGRPRENLDWVFWVAPIRPSTKGDGDGEDYGIVNPVALVAVGDAYTEDVFVKPGMDRYRDHKQLGVDVTVRNTSDRRRTFQVLCEAVYDRDGQVEKKLAPVQVTVHPRDSATVSLVERWDDPKLWWPESNPHLYRLRTTISEDGKPLDVQEELFGFRWVTIKGPGIYINNVRRNFWNWVGVHGRPWTEEEWLEQFREENNRFTRFSQNRKTSMFLKSREERLEFYDRNGIPGRLCSMIDGMTTSNRTLGLRTYNPVTLGPLLIPNAPVWEGFERHIDQLTRAYRNHPSVIFYQVENELIYITGMNVYGSYLDRVEQLMGEVIEAGRRNDPTRPYTVGGGGDSGGYCEINSPHYPHGRMDWYPDNAYLVEKFSPKIERWPWTRKKPYVVGESCHANQLAFGSYVLGDEVFRGIMYARRGKAKFLRMLYSGYRWAGVAGFFPWDNLYEFEDARKTFSDLCVIPRKQTHRLFAGRENEFLFKVMNDTLKSDNVAFEWEYTVGDQRIARGGDRFRAIRGFGQEQTVSITAPEADKRLEGTLTLRLSQPDVPESEAFVDARSVPVLPVVDSIEVDVPVHLLDRPGRVAEFLNEVGVEFEKLDKLADARGKNGLLIVGPDTLTPEEAFGRDILTFAGQGGSVIVLEQDVPVAGGNLPAPLPLTTHYGGYAHPQALGTPVFRDLGKEDLIDWAGEHPVYKHVYEKPTQGGRSLAEAGPGLNYSPLIEMPAGQGVIILCQMRVGAKLGKDPAAGILLRNLMERYAGYRPSAGIAAVYAPDNRLLVDRVAATGALTEAVVYIEAALDPGRFKAAVIHASEGNLKALLRQKRKARAFQEAGGWILLSGLDRDGIEEYNEFLGAHHMLRPGRCERITLERPDFGLAATLGNRDLSMYGTRWLAKWKGIRALSEHVFSCVVDGRDIAPFCQMPAGPEDPWVYEPTFDDHDPYNFVNGLTRNEYWRYIRQIWIPEEGAEPLVFRLRHPDVVKTIRIWNNDTYWTIKDLDVIFDGNEEDALRMVLPDARSMVEAELPEPKRVRESITLQIRSWRARRPDRPDLRLVGIDNVQFLRPERPRGAVFIDSTGGLVAYPKGKGGTMLCQVKFMKEEPVQANAAKKLRILNVLLQNMGVGSKGATVALPGVNIRYEPVNLTDRCTQYLMGREGRAGWFGRSEGMDMRNLQVGEQRLAEVLFHLVDYATAPVPDCIMLGTRRAPEGMPKEVTGIKVGKKADVLFFLHAANVTRPISAEERSRIGARRRGFELPELLRYVIHYEDGEVADIPVLLEKHVDHWLQAGPKPLAGALVGATVQVPWFDAAWFEKAKKQSLDESTLRWGLDLPRDATPPDAKAVRGVLYAMQADNPRPQVAIASIDIVPGKDGGRAVPAVLAITLGTVIK